MINDTVMSSDCMFSGGSKQVNKYLVCSSTASCEVYCLSGGNLRCIPTSWLCDGISDCDYNSDENSERCGQLTATTTATTTTIIARVQLSQRNRATRSVGKNFVKCHRTAHFLTLQLKRLVISEWPSVPLKAIYDLLSVCRCNCLYLVLFPRYDQLFPNMFLCVSEVSKIKFVVTTWVNYSRSKCTKTRTQLQTRSLQRAPWSSSRLRKGTSPYSVPLDAFGVRFERIGLFTDIHCSNTPLPLPMPPLLSPHPGPSNVFSRLRPCKLVLESRDAFEVWWDSSVLLCHIFAGKSDAERFSKSVSTSKTRTSWWQWLC